MKILTLLAWKLRGGSIRYILDKTWFRGKTKNAFISKTTETSQKQSPSGAL